MHVIDLIVNNSSMFIFLSFFFSLVITKMFRSATIQSPWSKRQC